jgi:hypothetical protein
MKPSHVLSEAEKRSLDYETVVDCHFATPPPGKKDNRILCYCRRCKKLIKEFHQDVYDEKFLQPTAADRSLAHQEILLAWLDHNCAAKF